MKKYYNNIIDKAKVIYNKSDDLSDKIETKFKKVLEHKDVKDVTNFLTDTSTFKKTITLSLFYVFLFYLPFTVLTLVLDDVVFFQLDHLFQFSTFVFDFRNRIFTGNFSTWDWKNALGYDYFANFYYVPVDISFLPFLVLPFLSYHKLMWISFLLKILIGTALFSYLLKLYKLSGKTIVFASVIFGTADLFFAQNVFPSFTGLIIYIPLLLIGIEYIVQKRNYFVFSLIIFQLFLFNFYWAWPLSLFMAIALFIRLYNVNFRYVYTGKVFAKSIFFYLLGVGMAAFFLMPIMSVMQAEPRLGAKELFDNILLLFKDFGLNYTNKTDLFKTFFEFHKHVYYKTIFKTLVPNLFAYQGYFYDPTQSYFLPTNHIIIYSSILATYTVIQFIMLPAILIKHKLNRKQYLTFIHLKWTTLVTVFLMAIPTIAYIFSAAQQAYLRWFVFFGVLVIINFAFLYEYKLINKGLLMIFLMVSSAYLAWANYFNDLPEVFTEGFHATDETASYTMLIAYGAAFILLLIFFRSKYALQMVFVAEKIAMISLIFTLLVADGYSSGVRHHSVYGKEMNKLLKTLDNKNDYKVTQHFLYYNDYSDSSPMQNFAYLNNYGAYNNSSTFHSLINPYYDMVNNNVHYRSYLITNMQYFYYLYMDPTQYIISSDNNSDIKPYMQGYDSTIVASKQIPQFNSTLSIYQKEPNLALGVGFTKYMEATKSNSNYNWLDAVYANDLETINKLKAAGFKSIYINKENVSMYSVDRGKAAEIELPNFPYQKFAEFNVDITREDAETIYLSYFDAHESIKVLVVVDNNDQKYRCYNLFCDVPEAGIKQVLVGTDKSAKYINPKSAYIYLVKQDIVDEKLAELRKYATTDVKIDGNTVTSKVSNDQPVIMNYKIGYAPGWKGYVDGKEVELFPAHGGLLSFILEDTGDHDIVLTYETPGLAKGIKYSKYSFIIFFTLLTIWLLTKPAKKYSKYAYVYLKDNNYNVIKVGKDVLAMQKTKEFIRFVIIGVIATLIQYVFYYLFVSFLNRNIALTIGYIISFSFNFFASNVFTFKTKINFTNGYRFGIAHLMNYFTQLILLNVFIFLGLGEKIALIPVLFICIPLNFIYVRFALKRKI